jgi:small-conductance mechanosensitive channel/CRP-like cAMP-binding protein
MPAASLVRRRLTAAISLALVGLAGALLQQLLARFGRAWFPLYVIWTLAAGLSAIQLASLLVFELGLPRMRLSLPAIGRDMVLAGIYVASGLAALSAYGVQLSGLIATSAVVTGILAISLQDTLGNVLGGVVLQLEESLAAGDYIRFGSEEGVVREVRWRQTKIDLRTGDLLMVPNSVLMKGPVLVLARGARPGHRRMTVTFSCGYEAGPAQVIEVVQHALRGDLPPLVAAEPAPECLVMEFKDTTIAYAVRYWLLKPSAASQTDSAVRTRLFYALTRAGIRLSVPVDALVSMRNDQSARERRQIREQELRVAALHGVDMLKTLTADELLTIAGRLRRAPFSPGETLVRQGSDGDGLYIVSKGRAEVRLRSESGAAQTVATLKTGDFMGEMSLMTGEPRFADVVAADDVECYVLDRDGFQDIVKRRPELAEQISLVLAKRQVALDSARHTLDESARADKLMAERQRLVSRIRRFFSLA